MALLLKVGLSDEVLSSQRVFDVLVSPSASMSAAVVVEAVVLAYLFRKQERQDANRRTRPNGDFSFVLRAYSEQKTMLALTRSTTWKQNRT